MKNFITECSDSARRLSETAQSLESLAAAFAQTGNLTVSNELFDLACNLRAESVNIREIMSDRVSSDLRIAQEQTGAMIRTALVVAAHR